MIYCALDQALKITGGSIYDDDKLVAGGTNETNATQPIELRLGTIGRHLTSLYEKYNFEHIFFEETQKQVNVETFKRLCYVQAVIMLWCYYNDIKYTILSPSHGRKVIKDKYNISFGRKREEQKKAAQQFVEQHYKIKTTEDEADSICIGTAGILEYNKNRSAF